MFIGRKMIQSIFKSPRSAQSLNLIRSYCVARKLKDIAERKTFKLHLIEREEGPETTVLLTKEQAARYLRKMLVIRKTEKQLAVMYRERSIRGFCHLYVGEEACAVGLYENMSPDDELITSYRCHGHAYLTGVPLENIIAELMGKVTGQSGAKGGSMHIYGKRFYGGNGIVGAQVPLGTGIALAAKYNNKNSVCFTCLGDGASNQGQVYESYNMAKIWELPIVYIIENNKFAMGTSSLRSSATQEYHNKVTWIPGVQCDGMDIVSVRECLRFARNYAIKNGPIIIDLVTYRFFGHSMSDPGTSYRSRKEVLETKKRIDPIYTFRATMRKTNLLSEDEMATIDNDAKRELADALAKASQGTEPPLHHLYCDMYCKILEEQVRSPFGVVPTKNNGRPV